MSRAEWTGLTDSQLLAQCEVDTYRASGPGGQKRNKTSSAVRIRHKPSGLSVIAEESRSQHENRARALKRLKQAFFLKRRELLPEQALAEIAQAPELSSARSAAGGLDERTRGTGRSSAWSSTCWRPARPASATAPGRLAFPPVNS